MVSAKRSNAIEDDGFSYICSICKDFGELICCEQCGQGFHLQCLNLESLPDEDPWFCADCKNNQVRCFECKEIGTLNDDTMFKCCNTKCNKFYHHKCSENWEMGPNTKAGFLCPQHICDACRSRKNSGQWKLLRCLECPIACHGRCYRDGMLLLDDIPGYMICWKHNHFSTHECNKDEHNNGDIFTSLAVPRTPTEFELPQMFHEFVKKIKNRPPPFSHIRRNIYLVKRPKRSSEEDYSCSCKRLGESKELCERQCLCSMLQYSCSSSCGCEASCTNLPFQKRPGRKLQLIKTEKCGWGLTAAENIKTGDFLIEYVGEVINDKMCEERLWGMKERGENNFYMCEINREMVIDATFKGNLSRFINHSCCPNTQLQKWLIDGETRIGVFAISDIQEGEFISYDYQFIPFGQDQECYCGALACRGKLGRKPSKQKLSSSLALEVIMSNRPKRSKACALNRKNNLQKFFRLTKPVSNSANGYAGIVSKEKSADYPCIGIRIKVWWPLDQKFYGGKIVQYDKLNRTHTVEYDDGEVEVLNMEKERWELEKPILPPRKRKPDYSVDANNSAESQVLALGGDITSNKTNDNGPVLVR